MKRLVKVPAVAAVILTLATAGVSSARAGGWTVVAGVVGGFAAGTTVCRAVANYPPPPAYYVYPQRVYVAPLYAPAPVIVPLAPVCYATAPVVYPFYDPPIQLGGIYGAAALLSPVVGRAQVHALRREFSDIRLPFLRYFVVVKAWAETRSEISGPNPSSPDENSASRTHASAASETSANRTGAAGASDEKPAHPG